MDNFFNNAGTSNIDALIENFKVEVTKKSDDNFPNTRKLTVQSTAKTEVDDIDKQILDLENLIQKLQEEIIEMSKNADTPIQEELDLLAESEEAEETDNNQSIIHKEDLFYPVMLQDVGFLTQESKKLSNEVLDLNKADTNKQVPESFSEIGKEFARLWEDVEEEKPHDETKIDDGLENLICVLKAEISEQLESLKDVDIGQPLNNSMEELQ